MNWTGVMPAMTTAFHPDFSVNHAEVAQHAQWLVQNGCSGIICLGSLGEASTLRFQEKIEILKTVLAALNGVAPVVASISALSTAEAVELATQAHAVGCSGLMILPPYVYNGDWRENKAHVAAILKATPLPGMLYNNPVAYGTDFLPEQIKELAAEHENLEAVKESSTDARRVSAIRALVDRRLEISVGVDDAVLEAVGVGATGWVAGLANALPRESVDLFNLGIHGESGKAFELYRWFLPLLRMDTVFNFVQLIKLVQAEVGMGNARVRPPRLPLLGIEREQTMKIVRDALQHRPQSIGTYALPNGK